MRNVGLRRASRSRKGNWNSDRVSDFHVADPTTASRLNSLGQPQLAHSLTLFLSTLFSHFRSWRFSLWLSSFCHYHYWYALRTCTKYCKVRPRLCGTGPAISDHSVIPPPIVSRSATDQEIRKAYKRLSRKYHPDKNQSPGAEDKFVEVAHGRMNPFTHLCA